jgi:hypothetical protein
MCVSVGSTKVIVVTDSYFGETSFRSNDNVFNLTGSSLSSTHDENNETYFCKICTDWLPKFTDSYFGETSFRSNDNVFNLTGSSLSSTRDENSSLFFLSQAKSDRT